MNRQAQLSVLTAVLAGGCGYFAPAPPVGILAFSASFAGMPLRSAAIPRTAVAIVVTVSGTDMQSPQIIKLTPDQSQQEVRDLPLGSKTVQAETQDASGTALSRGANTVTVEKGLVKPVLIKLVTLPPDQAPTLFSIAVTPPSSQLPAGGTVQLAAAGTLVNDATLNTLPWGWSTSNDKVARVTDQGLVTAVGPGQATITATFRTVAGTASVQVQAGPSATPTPSTTPTPSPSPSPSGSPSPTPTPASINVVLIQQ